MDDEQLRQWNALRLELFAGAKIPPHALAAILHDARRMDFDRAMRALPIYRAAKPYRGFYAVDWARHYEQTRTLDAESERTDGAAARAAAARLQDEQKHRDDIEREIREYMAVPPAKRDQAAEQLAYLGWPTRGTSRAWRVIVTMWHRGDDVSSLFHPSKLGNRLDPVKQNTVTKEELARELRALIAGARIRLKELEDTNA